MRGFEIMTNYEKRIYQLTIDKLIQLENTIHECSDCYCREYCISISEEQLSCDETRKKWLASDES